MPRKAIFEIFEKNVILAIFLCKNNVDNMCSPLGSNSRRLVSAIINSFQPLVNHYIHSATPG